MIKRVSISVMDFDLDQIFDCGQCFRWYKEEDGSWPYPAFMYRDIWGSANYVYDSATLPDAYAKREWVGYRIKKGEHISTKTLDALCYVLDCKVEDIIEFVKE